ncbi:MAG: radical SAM protein [Deltaproteobacteria bacterium]|nr:radical SAM protein [Deltaproteobacteria bacterium]MBW2418517.1 radical SAM protein [Deltaproteobacteria bacterium]
MSRDEPVDLAKEEPQDAELRDFLKRFRLDQPTRVHEIAERSAQAAAEAAPERGPARSRGGIQPLVDWHDYPPNITFDPTGRCNVVCEMCDFHRVRSDKGWKLRQMPELSPEVLRARLAEKIPMRTVTFSGGGAEFFLNKRWPELIDAARSQTRDIVVLTNGTTLNEKTRHQIVEKQIESIRVSFHGARAETAMEIMRGSRFEDVKRNLAELVRLREARALPYPRLHISFVGMRKNIDEFPDFVALAAELGADSVTLSSMMERDAEGMEHTRGQSLVGDPERLRRNWRAGSQIARERGVRLLSNDPYQNLLEGKEQSAGMEDDEPHAPVTPGKTKLCLFPFDKPFVGLNGSVGLCCSSTGRNVEMGNADLASFRAVWHGENYSSLRRSLITGEHLPDFCAQCPRAPNVHPKTMEIHAALLHARTTGRAAGLWIALRNARHRRRYVAELAALNIPRVGIRSVARAVLMRGLRHFGLAG